MKTINSNIRGRNFFGDLQTARHYGQSSSEKRIYRKTERARQKMSLLKQLHGQAGEDRTQLHIESKLLFDEVMQRAMAIASARRQLPKVRAKGTRRRSRNAAHLDDMRPHEQKARYGIWAETDAGRVLIASCDCA